MQLDQVGVMEKGEALRRGAAAATSALLSLL